MLSILVMKNKLLRQFLITDGSDYQVIYLHSLARSSVPFSSKSINFLNNLAFLTYFSKISSSVSTISVLVTISVEVSFLLMNTMEFLVYSIRVISLLFFM